MKRPTSRIRWTPFFSRGQHPTIVNDLVVLSLPLYPRKLGLPLMTMYRRDTSTYFEAREYERLNLALGRTIDQTPQKILRLMTDARRLWKPLFRLATSLTRQSWKKKGSNELVALVKRYYDATVPTYVHIYWPIWVDRLVEQRLRPVFRDAFGSSWESPLWIATRPLQLTTGDRYKEAVLKSAIEYSAGRLSVKQAKLRAKQLAARYGHLGNYMFRYSPFTQSHVLGEITRLAPAFGGAAGLASLRQERRRLRREQAKILGRLTPRQRMLAEIAASAGFLREERMTWYNRALTLVHPLLAAAARSLGLSYEEFIEYRYEELVSGRIERSILQARRRGYDFRAIRGKVTIRTRSRSASSGSTRARTLRGFVAYPGKIRGRVQFGDAYTFKKFKPGRILVTAMTTPDAIPYVKRAKAIVTDEGGTTAHAAVVAREFKIPCIVGTKNATKVLKDGDMVEVDATRGVVKKL